MWKHHKNHKTNGGFTPQKMGYNFITPKNEGNMCSHGLLLVFGPIGTTNDPIYRSKNPRNWQIRSIAHQAKAKASRIENSGFVI